MDKEIASIINAGRHKFFLAITGGGTSFIGDYISHGGASKVLIGAYIPYAQSTFDDFIRGKVERYASEEGARRLALASHREVLKAGVAVKDALGVGASCSIASTSPEREGRKHRFYVATHKYDGTHVAELILNQGRSRAEEEQIVKHLISNMMLSVITEEIPPYGMRVDQLAGEVFRMRGYNALPDLADFYNGAGWIDAMPNFDSKQSETLVIYPGSWNPIHDGHLAIKNLAQEILGAPVILEFTINNTDKARIDYLDLKYRLEQLNPHNYILTRASFFRSKVALLKELYPRKKLIFVVGEDTWSRIWNKEYCESNSISREADFFVRNQVQFLVFARGGKPFQALGDMVWGEPFRVKDSRAENFSIDISSSTIRKQQQQAS